MNRTLRRTTLLLITLFGLAACAPIVLPRLPNLPIQLPQGYPVQQPGAVMPMQAQRPQQRLQNAQVIPQAGALTAAPPVAVARARTAQVRPPPRVVPAGRQVQRQVQRSQVQRPQQRQIQQQPAAQIAVPPRLNPVQQARRTNVNQQNYNYRPSASANAVRVPARSRQPIWEDNVRTTAPARKQAAPAPVRRPSAAVRKPTASVSSKKTRVAPVTKRAPAKPAVQAQKAESAKVEVLDLSGSLAANTKTTAAQAKKTALVAAKPRSYSNSPAVAVLTKQANNQLTVGKAGQAAATLERALRIEPDNPLLWLRLAEVNAQQGKKSQAASMARKALNFAPGDAGLQARGQRLLN